ncbi:HAD family hydrolase [Gryllotalpicola ginsengisoli]|uniref:HAD family hydrolase n=1 Tax=Gryllotalpicola ginsengisoli TaxID=444608 RepID=UPI0003B683B3|nr:HAD family hydrolase [Gryllotalpicola ginsengisoli]
MDEPDALLLDLDGTLIDWVEALEAGVAAGAARIAEAHGLDAAEITAATLAFEAEVYELHATGWLLGGVGTGELYGALWRRALEVYGLDEPAAGELAEAQWAAELAAFRAYDDVAGLIERAAGRGIRLALVTNGPSVVQRAKLEATGLADAFDAVVISAEAGVAKPEPRIFRTALDALGVAPGRAWHVGDSLEYDVAGAQAAGVRGVWLNRHGWEHGRHQPEPGLEIRSFDELLALCDSGNSAETAP